MTNGVDGAGEKIGLPPYGGSGLKFFLVVEVMIDFQGSPSIRREWIEIPLSSHNATYYQSPSIRREWIEIAPPIPLIQFCTVSLHTEGVD